MTQIGWSLEKTQRLDETVRDRVVATWRHIREEAPADQRGTLAGFGAWLGAEVLDAARLVSEALQVLALGVRLEPDFVVYRALPRLAEEHPLGAVEILRRMVVTDANGWSLAGSTDEARATLATALAADDDAREAAETVVHLLGARGMSEFRDLVADTEPS